MIDRRWLFICSCIALVTSAFTFVVRGDVLQPLGVDFGMSQAQRGHIESAVFYGMALSMLGGGFICDALGMKKIMVLAFLSHLVGAIGTIYAKFWMEKLGIPQNAENATQFLYVVSIIMGCGNGFTEVAVNPLVATLFPKDKTHYLNVLHAWWPAGLAIGGVTMQMVVHVYFPSGLFGLQLWQTGLWLIAIPAIIYGLMLLPAKFPQTERVESGVSNWDMFKECLRPMFFLWAFCMLLTASTELGPQKWQESVMTSTSGISGTIIIVYCSAMMFILRNFAGPIARALSPIGLLTISAVFSAAGLYLLSYANNAVTGFAYATLFGLGIAFFWPTMLGVTSERFPKGGALALALMGSVGNASIAYILPEMGKIVDVESAQDLVATNNQILWIAGGDAPFDGPTVAPLTAKIAPLVMSKEEWKTAYSPEYGGPLSNVLVFADGPLKPVEVTIPVVSITPADAVTAAGTSPSIPTVAPPAADVKKPKPEKLDAAKVEEVKKKTVEALLALYKADPAVGEKVVKTEAARKELLAKEPALETVLSRNSLDLDVLQAAAKGHPTAEAAKLHVARYKALAGTQAVGFAWAFRWVSILPGILIVLFAGIFLYDRARGGYKAEVIGASAGGH